MASDLDMAGQSNHHAGLELDLLAKRTECDTDQCFVERRDSGRWKSDRNRIQRELQRIEPAAGDVLPERNAVRIGIGFAAHSDANIDSDGDAHRDADGDCNADPDSNDAADRYSNSHADCDCYRNSDEDRYADQHAHSDIDIATDCDADSHGRSELSRQLLG